MRGKILIEVNEDRGGIANQHLLAVQRVYTDSVERTAICKLVDRHVVPVRPDAKFAIVGKLIAGCLEVVGKVNSAGITILRDGNTLMVRRRSQAKKGKLRYEPAIGHAVVEEIGRA